MRHICICKELNLASILSQFAPLTLSPDAAVDFHMHTTYSDGRYSAPQLLDLLVEEGFQLVAVTDHDRVDRVAEIQALAAERGLPVLAGVEMSTEWNGKMGHMLCYGFDPKQNELLAITEDVRRMKEAGHRGVKSDMARTVEAAHKSGAVCLIAHPGRREHNFTFYDPALLDQLRQEIPIDGIEVYHPYHSPEIIEVYLKYVQEHDLLYSTGSDTHCVAGRMPIKYKAEISRKLLERLGVNIS